MKLLGGLLGLVILVGVGGFIYLSVSDVNVPQTEISKPVEPAGAKN